jgi:hypothetical protein
VWYEPHSPRIRKPQCPAHPVWALAQRAILEALSGAMIADLAAGTTDQAGARGDSRFAEQCGLNMFDRKSRQAIKPEQRDSVANSYLKVFQSGY